MESSTDFKDCSTFVSEVANQLNSKTEKLRGKCIWEVNGWNFNVETMRATAFCTIKVGSLHAIRLYFGCGELESQAIYNDPDPSRPSWFKKRASYVPLWVELKMVGCNYPKIDSPVTVYVDVHQLSEDLGSEKIFASGRVTFKLGDKPRAVVIKTFLEHSYTASNNRQEDFSTSQHPEKLRFGIVATMSRINKLLSLESSDPRTSESEATLRNYSGKASQSVLNFADLTLETGDSVTLGTHNLELNKPLNLESCQEITPEIALIEQLKKMYKCDANFPDLKFETSDNMTLSAHKFIVAARSSIFHELIKIETQKANFSGTMKVYANAKPMLAILHWMYTGEIYEKAGLVMEEVIEAAMRFDLHEFLKILDNKMISICTEENMFRLYQAAKKFKMTTAIDDIGSFIKSNV